MVNIDECIKIGNKYYDSEEFVKKVLNSRINPVVPEDFDSESIEIFMKEKMAKSK